MAKKDVESKAYTAGGLVFVGGIMTGIGLGIYYGFTAVRTLVGIDVGFILFGLVVALTK